MQTPHGLRHTLPPARQWLLQQQPSELETWPPNWRTRSPVVPWLCLVRGPGPAPGVHEAGLEALYSLARWWLHCICSRGLAVAAGDEAVMHASINDLQWLRCCCGIFLQVGGVRSIPASLSKNRAVLFTTSLAWGVDAVSNRRMESELCRNDSEVLPEALTAVWGGV